MGGATISFINMINGLIEKGVTPIIIIPKSSNDINFMEFIKKNNIELYKTNIAVSYYTKSNNWKDFINPFKYFPLLFIKKFSSYFQLLKLCKKIKPDIIHTNVGIIHEPYYVAKRLSIPHIWHLREYQTLDFNMKIIPSFGHFCNTLKKSYVVTITNDIKKYFKLDSTPNAQTIYNGIFFSNEARYNPNKEKIFLCASRISPEKGHRDIIKAFGEFCKIDKDYVLYIAGFGDSNYIKELKDIAIEYNCLNRIKFVGFIKDIKQLMQIAKALIVGSYNEGFGRMTAEACFCGCIVIGRNTGGTKEILDKTGGLQFTSNDELLELMKQVRQFDENQYRKRALSAQNKSIELYSIENNIQEVYNLYKKIIS